MTGCENRPMGEVRVTVSVCGLPVDVHMPGAIGSTDPDDVCRLVQAVAESAAAQVRRDTRPAVDPDATAIGAIQPVPRHRPYT